MATESRPQREDARIAMVLDDFQAVLNKGAKDGIKIGEAFLIYAIGPEVNDPITGENLGPLEMVKGHAKVINLQENLALIRSSETKPVYSSNPPVFRPVPTHYEEQPFRGIEVGDFARPI